MRARDQVGAARRYRADTGKKTRAAAKGPPSLRKTPLVDTTTGDADKQFGVAGSDGPDVSLCEAAIERTPGLP